MSANTRFLIDWAERAVKLFVFTFLTQLIVSGVDLGTVSDVLSDLSGVQKAAIAGANAVTGLVLNLLLRWAGPHDSASVLLGSRDAS